VVLAIRVDAGGCARAVAVLVSTGSERLDTAALSWIEEAAEFSPATTNGKTIESVKELAVTFKLGQPDAPG